MNRSRNLVTAAIAAAIILITILALVVDGPSAFIWRGGMAAMLWVADHPLAAGIIAAVAAVYAVGIILFIGAGRGASKHRPSRRETGSDQ